MVGFVPPWPACMDFLKGLFVFVSALSPPWGFKSMDSHASQCGDSARFTVHFLLGCFSLLLAAASSGLCTRWDHLCHRRDEGLALYFAGGSAPIRWWLHYLRFQVIRILFNNSTNYY